MITYYGTRYVHSIQLTDYQVQNGKVAASITVRNRKLEGKHLVE
jgi:hypothetical protein